MFDTKSFVGNERVLQMLSELLKGETMPHALLFMGPPSVGKRTAAFSFLFALHARQKGANKERVRQLLPEGKLPDVHLLQPQKGSISIAAVRDIQERLSRSAMECVLKSALFVDVDAMTEEASNALLKTLEEPPAHSLLILTATSEESVLSTIRSRCAIVPFRAVPDDLLLSGLSTRFPDERDDVLRLAVLLAEGKPGHAISFLEQSNTLDSVMEEVARIGSFSQQSIAERFGVAKTLADAERVEVQELLTVWIQVLRITILTLSGVLGPLPPQAISALQPLLDRGEQDVVVLLRRALEVQDALRENANVRLTLESFLLGF